MGTVWSQAVVRYLDGGPSDNHLAGGDRVSFVAWNSSYVMTGAKFSVFQPRYYCLPLGPSSIRLARRVQRPCHRRPLPGRRYLMDGTLRSHRRDRHRLALDPLLPGPITGKRIRSEKDRTTPSRSHLGDGALDTRMCCGDVRPLPRQSGS
jgi:hypothetical protein